MKLFTILRNMITKAKAYTDTAEQNAKDYADAGLATKLTVSDLKYGTLSGTTTVAGNSTAWLTLTVPDGRIIIAPAGFYWYGSNNVNVMAYAYRQISSNQIQFALRNWGSASASLTVDSQYVYIDA